MAYYDTVRNRSTFRQKATSERAEAQKLILPYTANDKTSPVSLWGRQHLFALRVLCDKPTPHLTVLEPYLPSHAMMPLDDRVRDLIDGPRQDRRTLSEMSEPEIVGSYSPDSPGGAWPASGAPLRPEPGTKQIQIPTQQGPDGRPPRNRQPPNRYGNPVASDSIQFGSSPPDQRPPPPPSSLGSIGSRRTRRHRPSRTSPFIWPAVSSVMC